MASVEDIPDLVVLRDALVAEKDGAIKYTPLLQDKLNGMNLAMIDGKVEAPRPEILEQMQVEARTEAAALHELAITRLRAALADPVYAGQTAEQLVTTLSAPYDVTEERDAPDPAPAVVQQFVASLACAGDLILTRDGRVLSAHAGVQKELDGLIAEARKQTKIEVLVESKPAPITKIWQGISYCRNFPTLANVQEALS